MTSSSSLKAWYSILKYRADLSIDSSIHTTGEYSLVKSLDHYYSSITV